MSISLENSVVGGPNKAAFSGIQGFSVPQNVVGISSVVALCDINYVLLFFAFCLQEMNFASVFSCVNSFQRRLNPT